MPMSGERTNRPLHAYSCKQGVTVLRNVVGVMSMEGRAAKVMCDVAAVSRRLLSCIQQQVAVNHS